jgi:DNA-binding transcriptional LysR family regulator
MKIGMHHPINDTIDMTDVQLFVAVARHESFVQASRRTGVPTSTVSRAVARLEDALGTRLLHRTSRRVVATQEGAWLLQRAAPLVDELSAVLDDVKERDDEPSGRLRVTAPVLTGAERIGQALIAYAAQHPRLSMELQLTNAVLDLRDEGLDLAFRAGPVTDPDVIARKLWALPFALAASPGFVKKELHGRKRLSAARLAEVPAVVTRAGVAWRFQGPDGKLTDLTPRAHFSANDPRVAVDAAKAGLGVVRAPLELVTREGKALVKLDCELGEPEGRQMFAVYPSRRLLPLRVKAAIDWVLKSVQV